MLSRSTSCACHNCWATGVATRWCRSLQRCYAPPLPPPLSPRARCAPPSCTPLRTRRARQTSAYTGLFRLSTLLACPVQPSRQYGLCMGSRAVSRTPSGNLYIYPHTSTAYEE
jgi:hypothetical protein